MTQSGSGEQSRDGSPSAQWRRLAVVTVKLIHTAVFALVSSCVLYGFACGVLGRPTRRTAAAVWIVLIETAVFAPNHGRCPLTRLAEHFGAETGRVTDIFLPRRSPTGFPNSIRRRSSSACSFCGGTVATRPRA